MTDDPPQPRSPSWVQGLLPPPPEIDPRRMAKLPRNVAQNSTGASSDDGLESGATPSIFVFGDSLYTMGVAVHQATSMVFAAEYNSFNLHSFNASCAVAFGRRRKISPKSEFYGFGGIFSVAARPDGGLYLAYDGNGCMAGNPASQGAVCAFVRHIELGPDGTERIVVHNLTSPKQMAQDAQGRLYIVEEWPEQVVRWDPRTGTQTVVLHNSEYESSGPIEGIAISSNGDIYFSEYGSFGNQVMVANGAVSGVPIRSGAVWVKRAASGEIVMVARGFWRARGLALDEPRGLIYVANEANAWDQGSSGCLSQIELVSGNVKKVAIGLDYPQYPALEQATGRVFVPLALHDMLVVWDPRLTSALSPVKGIRVWEEHGISASINGGNLSAVDATKPTLSIEIEQLSLPFTLTAGINADKAATTTGCESAATTVSVWVRIPAELLSLYKQELPYNGAFHAGPDTFTLPNAICTLSPPQGAGPEGSAGVCQVSVQPNHRHNGPRWPMLSYNGSELNYRGRLFPQESWDASPESYLLFLHARFY